MSLQQYDFTAPANAPQTINAAGSYFKYRTGNAGGGDTTLIVTPGVQGGARTMLLPGQAIRLPAGKTAQSWTIQNALGGELIAGNVVIGDGQIDDNTMSGVVEVVDGGKSRTLANSAFGIAASQAGAAGQYSRVQLWNPAGSGTRCVIESIQLANGNAATQGAALQFNAIALATNIGNGVSKKSGGAASVAMCCSDTNGAAAGVGESSIIAVAGTTYQIKFAEPIIVTPGFGLIIYGGVVNEAVQANFEWYEEPDV